MSSEPNNQENPTEGITDGTGRHQGKTFWATAILLPPALLLCGAWMLLIANYLLAAVFFFAAMASLAYFAAKPRRGRSAK
ncbi:UNVERIFIED_ORG: amino acid permease [Arthrobacter sp. UYCu721]